MITIITALGYFTIIYFLLLGFWYGLTLLASFPEVINSYKEVIYGDLYKLLEQESYIPLTIIMPVFNEEHRIMNAIYAILQSTYKNVQIIVVSDGSTDHTLDLLHREFGLYEIPPVIKQVIKTQPIKHVYKSKKLKNLMVIDKVHNPAGNGADSINCGLNALTTPIFLTVDADTILEPNALTSILFRFFSKKHCIMVAGSCYVLNENKVDHGRLLTTAIPKNYVCAFQGLEYLRSFTYGRTGLNTLAGALCSPGAFTLNETYIVKEAKGYDPNNYAYDTEITLRLHNLTRAMKYPTKIIFMPSAISWTEVPGTLKRFWKQRVTWQRGMLRAVFKYIKMFFNPYYGMTGMVTFPAYVAFDVFSPVIECFAYILLIICLFLGIYSWQNLFWFVFFAWGFIVIMSIFSFYLDLLTSNKFKNFTLFHLIWLVTLEMFGFRQFRAAACLYGTLYYFFRRLTGKYL